MNYSIISGGMTKGLWLAVILMLSVVNAQANSLSSSKAVGSLGAVLIFPTASVQAMVMTSAARLNGKVESVGASGRAVIVLSSASQTVGESVRFAIDKLPTSSAVHAGDTVQMTPVTAVAGAPVLGHTLTVGGEFLLYVAGDDAALQLRSRQIDA